jgi:hypothetical protein
MTDPPQQAVIVLRALWLQSLFPTLTRVVSVGARGRCVFLRTGGRKPPPGVDPVGVLCSESGN